MDYPTIARELSLLLDSPITSEMLSAFELPKGNLCENKYVIIFPDKLFGNSGSYNYKNQYIATFKMVLPSEILRAQKNEVGIDSDSRTKTVQKTLEALIFLAKNLDKGDISSISTPNGNSRLREYISW